MAKIRLLLQPTFYLNGSSTVFDFTFWNVELKFYLLKLHIHIRLQDHPHNGVVCGPHLHSSLKMSTFPQFLHSSFEPFFQFFEQKEIQNFLLEKKIKN